MITAFDLWYWFAAITFVCIVGKLTHDNLSSAWLFLAIPLALPIAHLVGRAPYVIVMWIADRQFRKLTNEGLLSRITPEHFVELPFVLEEMARRGMDLRVALQPIEDMLGSSEVFDKDYVRRARANFISNPEDPLDTF